LKTIIFCITLFISYFLSAQQDDKLLAKETIDTFFEGFHKGDTLVMRSVLGENVIMQTAYRNKEGKSVLVTSKPNAILNAISKRPEDQKWDERLLDYNIQIDGNMANVWTTYEFWFNNTFHHCGVNSFQLFKSENKWKIIYWSQK